MHQLNYFYNTYTLPPRELVLTTGRIFITSYFFSTKPNTNVLHLQVLCQRTLFYYYKNNKSQHHLRGGLRPPSLQTKWLRHFVFRYSPCGAPPRNAPTNKHAPLRVAVRQNNRRHLNSRINIIHLHENVKLFFIFLHGTQKTYRTASQCLPPGLPNTPGFAWRIN